MNRQQWAKPVSQAEAHNRATGRRKHNARRSRQMWRRRVALVNVMCLYEELPHGWQQRMANRYSVHKSVIAKDVSWIRQNFDTEIGTGKAPKITFRHNRITSIVWEWP